MSVELYQETASAIQKKDLTRIANKAFKVLGLRENFSLSVAIVKKNTARSLNRIWRGINRPASVLAFGEGRFFRTPRKKSFILPAPERNFLGEIIIADSVIRQGARKRNSSYKKEFNFLFIHGLLHLLGYNHGNVRSRKKMEKLEKMIGDKVKQKSKER